MSLPPDPDHLTDDSSPPPVQVAPLAPAPITAPPTRLDKLKARASADLRSAMIDPAQEPAGDFDIIAQTPGSRSVDRVAGFAGLIAAMRFATTAVSLLLVATSSDPSLGLSVWTALVVAYAIWRAFKPIAYADDVASLMRVIGEVTLHVVAVAATGGWDSPLLFTLLTAVTVAGLARGFGFSLRVAIASVIAITFPYVLDASDRRAALVVSASWSAIVLLVALVAGYSRRISGEADRERELAMDRLGRLADANALLFSLHRVAQTLPASLDMGDVLDSTLSRMKTLVSFDSAAVLLFDEADAHWDVVRHQGLSAPTRLGPTELAPGLRRAIAENRSVYLADLATESGGGLNPRARSGVYTVLAARGSIIGLLLAYLGFELDRLVDAEQHGDVISDQLEQLRQDVRGVTREVRDTLYDLRTDVSEELGLGEVLEQFVSRVMERSELRIQVEADRGSRLPLLQEREMWRVAQEALANVERHSQATAVRIVWRCDGERALIDVTDNGVGFDQQRAGRIDSYGVLGMRERASSIGATLEIVSAVGRGTRVRCSLVPSELRESNDELREGEADRGNEPRDEGPMAASHPAPAAQQDSTIAVGAPHTATPPADMFGRPTTPPGGADEER